MTIPATPEALSFVDEEEKKPPEGLQRVFSVNERLPWKGLWFEISAVSKNRLMLKPIGETWKHHKQRTGQ